MGEATSYQLSRGLVVRVRTKSGKLGAEDLGVHGNSFQDS